MTTDFTITVQHGSYMDRQCFAPGAVNTSSLLAPVCAPVFQDDPTPVDDVCGPNFYDIGGDDERCEMLRKLSSYGVFITAVPQDEDQASAFETEPIYSLDNWQQSDIEELLAGVEITGKAILAFSRNSEEESTFSNEQEAFRSIMLFDDSQRIDFRRDNSSLPFCETNNKLRVPAIPLRASILCGGGNQFTAQTAVHELGHVFLWQTANDVPVNNAQDLCNGGVGFIYCMQNPGPDGGGSLGFGDSGFIFGDRSRGFTRAGIRQEILRTDPDNSVFSVSDNDFVYNQCPTGFTLQPGTEECLSDTEDGRVVPAATVALEDWLRGEAGWDERIQGAGACANATLPYVFSTFQQNACNLQTWLLEASPNVTDVITLTTTELEEAGADMFLNWVYFTVEGNGSLAFSDNVTPPFPAGEYEDLEGPGAVRAEWMDQQMTKFYTYYGWNTP